MNKVSLSNAAQQALSSLEAWLIERPGIVVAYSGGMDSGFLTLAAQRLLKEKIRAFFALTELMPADETAFAMEIARAHGFPLQCFEFHVLGLPVFKENPKDRCYHCKHAIFSKFIAALPDGWVLCDGSNLDDRSDYRPGKKALAELGVSSPLDDAGFDKRLIREVLHSWNLGVLDRPPQACLATRIATGTPITLPLLQQIEAGERILRINGFSGARFRHHGPIARIELPGDTLSTALPQILPHLKEFKALGFKHVTLDLEGYKCGSMS